MDSTFCDKNTLESSNKNRYRKLFLVLKIM